MGMLIESSSESADHELRWTITVPGLNNLKKTDPSELQRTYNVIINVELTVEA